MAGPTGQLVDVLYVVHPDSILEQMAHIAYVRPYLDKLAARISSFPGPVIVTRLSYSVADQSYYGGDDPGWAEGFKYTERFIEAISSNPRVKVFTDDRRSESDLASGPIREVLDDLFLEGRLGKIILVGCFTSEKHHMCVDGTRNALVKQYGADKVTVDQSLTLKSGIVNLNEYRTKTAMDVQYSSGKPFMLVYINGVDYRAELRDPSDAEGVLFALKKLLIWSRKQKRNPLATKEGQVPAWVPPWHGPNGLEHQIELKRLSPKRQPAVPPPAAPTARPPEPEQLSLPLDRMASRLESLGMVREAYMLDVIANTIDDAMSTNKATLFFDELANRGITPEHGLAILDVAEKTGIIE